MDERIEALRVGLPLQFFVKEKMLARALAEFIEKDIILKGGTALNYVYLHRRFSEDLDFDSFLDFRYRSNIFEVEGPWKFRDVLRWHAKYETGGVRDFIRIEIRRLEKDKERIAMKYVEKKPLEFFHGSILAGIKHYSLEFLTVQKIKVVAERIEGKDFFDLFNCLREVIPSRRVILDVEKFEGVKDIVERALDNVKRASARELSRSSAYIPRSFRPKSWRDLAVELEEMLEEFV